MLLPCYCSVNEALLSGHVKPHTNTQQCCVTHYVNKVLYPLTYIFRIKAFLLDCNFSSCSLSNENLLLENNIV